MKLLCWNINSLLPTVRNAVLKHGSWEGFFEHHSLDIACLQEAKVPEDRLTKEVCCVEGYQSFWAVSREKKGYSGTTTYASEAWAPLGCQLDCLGPSGSGEEDVDREGRVVITDHGAFTLVNVYVPNAGDPPSRPRLPFKLRFLHALKRRVDELAAAGKEVLLVGDFNIAAEAMDVHPALPRHDVLYGEEERAVLHAFLASYTDVWRHLHPDAEGVFTVWDEKTSARAFNQGLRIDYVLCTPGLLGRVVSCEVLGPETLPPKWSDHAGMLLELSSDVSPPEPHPPCPHWQRLHRRFNDPSQRSILAMFGGGGKAGNKAGKAGNKAGKDGSGGANRAGVGGKAGAGNRAAGGAAAAAAAAAGGGGPRKRPGADEEEKEAAAVEEGAAEEAAAAGSREAAAAAAATLAEAEPHSSGQQQQAAQQQQQGEGQRGSRSTVPVKRARIAQELSEQNGSQGGKSTGADGSQPSAAPAAVAAQQATAAAAPAEQGEASIDHADNSQQTTCSDPAASQQQQQQEPSAAAAADKPVRGAGKQQKAGQKRQQSGGKAGKGPTEKGQRTIAAFFSAGS